MSITYAIDGVPLDDPDGRWTLLKGTLVAAGGTIRTVDTVIPGVDGTTPGVYEPADTATLAVRIRVTGTSHGDLLANYGALLALLAPNADRTLTRTVDGVARAMVARGKSVTDPDFSPARTTLTVSATLRLPGVYWRGASMDWSKASAVSGTAYQVTTLYGSTAPIADGRILITGPIANPKVTDGSGAWCSLATTVAAGESALIDCAAWTVTRGTTVTLAGGGAAATGVIGNSGGPYVLRLTPQMLITDPRVTVVSLTMTGTGLTSATALAVRAAPAYRA